MLEILFTLSMIQGYRVLGYYTAYAFFNKFLGFGMLLLSTLCVYSWIENLGEPFLFVRVFTTSTGLLNTFYLLGYLPFFPTLRNLFIFLPSTEARLRGLMVDPNAYGGLLMIALILHLPTILRESKKVLSTIMLNWIVSASLALGLFLTTSRSAYLGFFAGLLTFFMLQKAWRKATALLTTTGIGITGVLLSPLRNAVIARIFSLKQVISRVDIMRAGLKAFLESPILGFGLGTFFELSQDYFGLPWKQIIHNSYLWILADMGLLGAAIWVYFFLTIIGEGRTLLILTKRLFPDFLPEATAIFSALVSMLVFAVGIEAIYQRHLWMLIGVILGTRTAWYQKGVISSG